MTSELLCNAMGRAIDVFLLVTTRHRCHYHCPASSFVVLMAHLTLPLAPPQAVPLLHLDLMSDFHHPCQSHEGLLLLLPPSLLPLNCTQEMHY